MNALATPPARKTRSKAAPQITIQTGPRNASTDPATGLRYYSWQGRRLPSVTSIRRLAGIPFGLHNWAIGKVVDRAVDEWRDISAELSKADPAAVQLVRHRLRKAATDERDAAGALGTAVHDAAATGKALGDVSPEIAPRLRQYLDWLRVSGAEVLGSEFQCWNLTVGYAGTADLLCRFPDGSIWVVDLKTGKGIYGEYALQLLAYLMAEFIGEDDTRDERLSGLLAQARGVAVLHLADDHWEFVSLRADAETWTAFRGLLAFGLWMRDHEARESFALGSRKGGDK